MLEQITVFIENKPGRMEEVTGRLAEENINLHALSLADTADFGILRMIVSEPKRALCVLRENSFMVKSTRVIAVSLGNSPGSLHGILRKLKELDISIEYMYAFTGRHREHDAVAVLRLANQDAVVDRLKDGGVPILGEDFTAQLNEARSEL